MAFTTKQYIIGGSILAALGIGTYVVSKEVKKAKSKKASKDISKGKDKNLGINIPALAQQIGMDLKIHLPWYDVRRSTENDDKVLLSVLKVPRPLIPTLSAAYTKRYPGRNLQEDLKKLLDDYNEVQYLFE